MITTLYAGILGLFYIAMTVFIVYGRFQHRINLGDGGNDNMLRRIRIHGNFGEYVPYVLLLMFLAEFEGAREPYMHLTGILLIIARLMHAYGLYVSPKYLYFRSGGAATTIVILAGLSIYCIQAYFFF